MNVSELTVRELTVSLQGRTVLDEITHTFEPGTLTLIVGRCGSGKTMLIETLAGLREPAAGEIRIGSEPLWLGRANRRTLNKQAVLAVGIAPQHPEQMWFAPTIGEEFRYTLRPYRLGKEEGNRRAEAAVSGSLGGDRGDWLQREPHALSGGQQRRLASGLLQAAEPGWLLLDEPTAGLDREAVAQLTAWLHAWTASGRSAVAVTHDPEALLEAADRVLILSEGRVAWSGAASELAAHPEPLEAAGLALPERLHTLRLLREAGIALPEEGAGHVPSAASAAAAIARTWQAADGGLQSAAWPGSPGGSAAPRTPTDAAGDGSDTQGPHSKPVPTLPLARSGAATESAGYQPKGHASLPSAYFTESANDLPAGQALLPPAHFADAADAASSWPEQQLPLTKPAMPQTRADAAADVSGDRSALPPAQTSPLAHLDPRAVWLAYMLITPGILMQSHWIGWLASAAIAALALRWARIPYTVWMRPAIGLSVFAIIASLVSGLVLGDVHPAAHDGQLWHPLPWLGFAPAPAIGTFHKFGLLVMIMLIGFSLMTGIRPLRLKRALEQGLRPLQQLRVPVEQFAMTAALMMRFIPVLQDEWGRFARIAAARGKYAVRPGSVPPSRLRATAIPYLMALLRLGETLSQTLIARGVGRSGRASTQAYHLRFGRPDFALLGIAACVLLVLVAVDRFFPA